MPMGEDTTLGRVGQGIRSAGKGLKFAGQVVTGQGAESALAEGDHASAAAISMGGLATEAATGIAAGLMPVGAGHATKVAIKGGGYAAMGGGKLMEAGGNKMASKQDQHDRYQDVVSGKRKSDAAIMPIDFQGARSNHDPGGITGAIEEARDGIADIGKKNFRKVMGGR
jgi:hypothetical protein